MQREVYIGLGSDLGDRPANLARGLAGLAAAGLGPCAASSVWETEGVDTPSPARFLNMVVLARSPREPLELLDTLLAIEAQAGRVRSARNAPRTLDLDLLWLDGVTLEHPRLVLPHPRMWQRGFVLAPLAEIAPALRDPTTGRTVAEHWRALSATARMRRLGSLAPAAPLSL